MLLHDGQTTSSQSGIREKLFEDDLHKSIVASGLSYVSMNKARDQRCSATLACAVKIDDRSSVNAIVFDSVKASNNARQYFEFAIRQTNHFSNNRRQRQYATTEVNIQNPTFLSIP